MLGHLRRDSDSYNLRIHGERPGIYLPPQSSWAGIIEAGGLGGLPLASTERALRHLRLVSRRNELNAALAKDVDGYGEAWVPVVFLTSEVGPIAAELANVYCANCMFDGVGVLASAVKIGHSRPPASEWARVRELPLVRCPECGGELSSKVIWVGRADPDEYVGPSVRTRPPAARSLDPAAPAIVEITVDGVPMLIPNDRMWDALTIEPMLKGMRIAIGTLLAGELDFAARHSGVRVGLYERDSSWHCLLLLHMPDGWVSFTPTPLRCGVCGFAGVGAHVDLQQLMEHVPHERREAVLAEKREIPRQGCPECGARFDWPEPVWVDKANVTARAAVPRPAIFDLRPPERLEMREELRALGADVAACERWMFPHHHIDLIRPDHETDWDAIVARAELAGVPLADPTGWGIRARREFAQHHPEFEVVLHLICQPPGPFWAARLLYHSSSGPALARMAHVTCGGCGYHDIGVSNHGDELAPHVQLVDSATLRRQPTLSCPRCAGVLRHGIVWLANA